MNNKQVKLSEADLEMIKRVREGKYADADIDPFADWEFDQKHEDMIHPFSNAPLPKRSFVPSKWERLKVSKYIQALKKGWMKTLAEKKREKEEAQEKEDAAWDIWADESIVTWRPRRMPKPITAPKRDLPGHAESFNPAEEYLYDSAEEKEWKEAEEEDRQLNY